jgi:hypothetical protein
LSVAFVLAATIYAFVERPISRIRNIRVVSGTALASMTFAGLAGVFLYGINGAPFRFPAQIQPIIAYENYDGLKDARPACWLANDVDFSTIAKECYPSPDPIKQSVLIWGDSHAARLYPGVRAVLDSGITLRNSLGTLARQFSIFSATPVREAIKRYLISCAGRHPRLWSYSEHGNVMEIMDMIGAQTLTLAANSR